MKKSEIKRDEIINELIKHNWHPNLDFLHADYSDLYWVVNKYSDEHGKFHSEYNDGSKYLSSNNYLVSPCKRYAITIKSKHISLHDSKNNYMKILTLPIDDIEIKDEGLKCGSILLLYVNG